MSSLRQYVSEADKKLDGVFEATVQPMTMALNAPEVSLMESHRNQPIKGFRSCKVPVLDLLESGTIDPLKEFE